MTHRIEREKWILYRHTSNFKIVCAVAEYLKNYTRSSISAKDKRKLILKLKELDLYNERNPDIPLDSINHRINTLAYYMFGYISEIEGERKFLFSPLGNLFLKHLADPVKLRKIFFTMLWSVQYPDPHFGTSTSFNLYPFRLIFRLLTDIRLESRLYAYEVAYLVVFVKSMNKKTYESLVRDILRLRQMSNGEIAKLFADDRHTYVNAVYEWDYYVSKLFRGAGVTEKNEGEIICRLQHGKTKTYRKVTRSYIYIKEELYGYCQDLLEKYPYHEKPLQINDPKRLNIDVIKEIYSFYPEILLNAIGERVDYINKLLSLPKLIEEYSLNADGKTAYLFEEILERAFNMFSNVEAKRIGGAGKTDIECRFITKNKKFAVDAKSTSSKLLSLNARRLAFHLKKIGGEYTVVVTPLYVPAVKEDIKSSEIVILRASTFSEFLYNCIINDTRDIDYGEFDDVIINNLGHDISSHISELTIGKFGVRG